MEERVSDATLAAPVSGAFAHDLLRLEGLDPGTCVPGALHLGAAPTRAVSAPDRAALSLLDEGAGPVAALAAARERIARDSHTVDAWSYVGGDAPDVEAAAAEQSAPRSALHGVPVGVKDVLDVAGMPTTGGSPYHSGDRARPVALDAGAVTLLRQAGAVVLGKTRTHEFAFGGTTPPNWNPRDLERIAGGSSGGSAAAVAAGHVRVALGSDTAGSVRIPASYCGVAGLVPSPGLLPVTGILPLATSLDPGGIIATGPADLAAASRALGLVDDLDPDADLAGLRIGIPRGTFEGAVAPEVVDAVQHALAVAERAGATLVDVEVPHQWAAVVAGLTIVLGEGADEHRERLADRPELVGSDVREQVALAGTITAATYVRAQRVRALLRAELLAALSGVDLLATPTMPCAAPTVAEANTGRLEVGGEVLGLADAHLRYNIGGQPRGASSPSRHPAGAATRRRVAGRTRVGRRAGR